MASTLDRTFPDQQLLYPGAIRNTIAHALFIATCSDMANEYSWERRNFSRQDSCGTRGTVTFADSGTFVAVIRNDKSNRCPWRLKAGAKAPYTFEPFLKGMPQQLKRLADREALQYVLDEWQGTTAPIISAAFWFDGDGLKVRAAESWAKVWEHGGDLFQSEFLGDDAAYDALSENYEFDDKVLDLVRDITAKKRKDDARKLVLSSRLSKAVRGLASDKSGLSAMKETLQEIGITLVG